jgi:Spy/CpxP family protein refolding chaperone
MSRYVAWAFAALLLVPAAGSAADVCERDQAQRAGAPAGDQKGDKPDQHERPKWWVDPAMRAELVITDKQSADIEAIWRQTLTKRTETNDRLDKLSKALDQMILNAADEAAVIAQIDKVEAARSEASKVRVLMLYRMNKVLTPEQRTKLDAKAKAMREQRGRGRGDR